MRISLFFLIIFSWGCKSDPKPIYFGEEICHYCKMTIVDKQHAAQAMTSKGKVYNFDAIECMVNLKAQNEKLKFEKFLVCDFDRPGEMILADSSIFLISESIPSPMGAFLSAFSSKEITLKKSKSDKDLILNWAELNQRFLRLNPESN
jgi:copper chaperone NosL